MSTAQRGTAAGAPKPAKFSRLPIERRAFRAPIDFLAAEHERQLSVCRVLDRLVHNPRHGVDSAELAAVRDYLVQDLPRHVADEEEDLFPLLRRRCPKGDDVEEVFELLCREHEVDQALLRELAGNLDALLSGRAFSDLARFMMNAFAFSETQRRHLAWENTVILPRARRHLSEDDKAALGRRMAARRGFGDPV